VSCAVPWWFWLIVALVVLAGYVAATSSRLDRLHARVDAARAALDAQLVRRAAVTLEIAASGLLDPATSVLLASAAHQARAADGAAHRARAADGSAAGDSREVDESALTGALRATFADAAVAVTLADDPSGRELLSELEAATTKVPLGRRFYNDAVRATLAVRRHRVVRWLRLAGRVPAPVFFEMDDESPPGLPTPDPSDLPPARRSDDAAPGVRDVN
jgi:hypothetical protein